MCSYRILLFLYVLPGQCSCAGVPMVILCPVEPWLSLAVRAGIPHSLFLFLKEPQALSILLENEEKQTCPFLGAGENRVGLSHPAVFACCPLPPSPGCRSSWYTGAGDGDMGEVHSECQGSWLFMPSIFSWTLPTHPLPCTAPLIHSPPKPLLFLPWQV